MFIKSHLGIQGRLALYADPFPAILVNILHFKCLGGRASLDLFLEGLQLPQPLWFLHLCCEVDNTLHSNSHTCVNKIIC